MRPRNWDNAFAQCFHNALDGCRLLQLVHRKEEWTLEPIFVVTSTRDKYSPKFEDNTVLEFSADSAVGELGII